MPKLQNKSALVTGGARGIGEAIARCFVREGADVIIADIDAENGRRIADDIGCSFFHLDVADEKGWNRLAAAHPQIDIVVNNAGITGFEDSPGPHDPEHGSLADWHRVHAVNLDGTFLGCRYAIGAMRAKGEGSIINISSRSGLVGIPAAAAYASSKAAIRNHSKSVALYCAQQGLNIRCNSIHPTFIRTPMLDDLRGNRDEAAMLERLAKQVPLGRLGDPDDVAYAVLYLASDESRFMTASEIKIDGGISAI